MSFWDGDRKREGVLSLQTLVHETQARFFRLSFLHERVAIVGQVFRIVEFSQHALFTGIETCDWSVSRQMGALDLHTLTLCIA